VATALSLNGLQPQGFRVSKKSMILKQKKVKETETEKMGGDTPTIFLFSLFARMPFATPEMA